MLKYIVLSVIIIINEIYVIEYNYILIHFDTTLNAVTGGCRYLNLRPCLYITATTCIHVAIPLISSTSLGRSKGYIVLFEHQTSCIINIASHLCVMLVTCMTPKMNSNY